MRHGAEDRGTRWAARAAWLAAGLALAPLAAAAQVAPAAEAIAAPTLEPVFSQAGIPAEATAGNAVLARDTAFASARRLAWDRMLADAGLPPQAQSPAQLDRLVSSIVIEQERVTPTRYSGRLTINFAPGGVRAALGRGSAGGATDAAVGIPPPPRPGPAIATVEAIASYRSLAEWLDLRRRLNGAASVAGVEIVGIAVDAARLRLALRQPPAEAAAGLAGLGVQLVPDPAPAPAQAGGWRVRLAGGG